MTAVLHHPTPTNLDPEVLTTIHEDVTIETYARPSLLNLLLRAVGILTFGVALAVYGLALLLIEVGIAASVIAEISKGFLAGIGVMP